MIFDFYDRFKSVTQGYGSFDYDLIDYRESSLALLDILVNGEKVDALSQIVHRERARARGLQACERLKEEIPRQMFKIAIQGVIGGEIISRTTISAFRKDVIAKCYGATSAGSGSSSKSRKRQETDEDDRQRQHPAERLPCRAEVGYGMSGPAFQTAGTGFFPRDSLDFSAGRISEETPPTTGERSVGTIPGTG